MFIAYICAGEGEGRKYKREGSVVVWIVHMSLELCVHVLCKEGVY
jgi:hypothetical protein